MDVGYWGFPNGLIPYDKMVIFEGEWCHPELARRLAGAFGQLRREGIPISATEIYRVLGVELDRALGRARPDNSRIRETSSGGSNQYFQKGREDAGFTPSAATPGYSTHGFALAADVQFPLSQRARVIEVFAAHGLLFTITSEWWHADGSGDPTVPLPDLATLTVTPTGMDWFDMAEEADLERVVSKLLAPLIADLNNLIALPEVQAGYRELIDGAYQNVLGRPADAGGMLGWLAQMNAGMPQQDIINAIAQSDEYKLRQIDRAYNEELLRPADEGGLNSWLNFMKAGNTEAAMREALRGSDEYKRLHL